MSNLDEAKRFMRDASSSISIIEIFLDHVQPDPNNPKLRELHEAARQGLEMLKDDFRQAFDALLLAWAEKENKFNNNK